MGCSLVKGLWCGAIACFYHIHSGLSDWVSCLHCESGAEANCLHDCCARQCALWWKNGYLWPCIHHSEYSHSLCLSLPLSVTHITLTHTLTLIHSEGIFSNWLFSSVSLSHFLSFFSILHTIDTTECIHSVPIYLFTLWLMISSTDINAPWHINTYTQGLKSTQWRLRECFIGMHAL